MSHVPRRGARRAARRAALQAIYQWLLNSSDSGELILQFHRAGYVRGGDGAYFEQLVRGVLADTQGLEAGLVEFLDRDLALLDPVERAILLLSAYELRERVEVPFRVVIDEALDLAKRYGAQDGHRYINGVLDRCARHWRPFETS